MIYLASPYSHEDAAIREQRANEAAAAALALITRGHSIYSPIASWHHWCQIWGLPFEYETWASQDRGMIEAASELWVLMLPGWRESRGIAAELTHAQVMSKPVKFVEPLTLRFINERPTAA